MTSTETDRVADAIAANKAAARRVLEEIFPADDEAALTDALTDDFVNHEAPPGTPPGPGGALFYMHLLARAFSDQRWTIENVVAEGDLVALHCVHSGRHTGDLLRHPAHGKDIRLQADACHRLVDGKGAEHWAVRDDASLMRQLTTN